VLLVVCAVYVVATKDQIGVQIQRPSGHPGIIRGQNGLMRVVTTQIERDGTMQRRVVDTARQSDRPLWDDLATRAMAVPVPYRPAPGIVVYHISVDDCVIMVAEYDLAGPLLDLVTAVMALGGERGQPP
jgi:hypothetical protein